MPFPKQNKRQERSGSVARGQEQSSSGIPNNNGTDSSQQHRFRGPPTGSLASSNGSGSGSSTLSGSTNGGSAVQSGQDKQQQLISELLNAAVRSNGSPVAVQRPHASDSAQLLLSQIQSIVGSTNTQTPNEILLQQLQQLIQPQILLSIPPGSNTETTFTQSSTKIEQQGELDERKPRAAGAAAAAADVDISQQASARQDEGQPSAVVPCRARGMPPEHNASTAFFVVPHDVKHGSNLYCSFPACRNEGIKFCYCSHCGIPVAKRNFRQRHDHASSKKKGDTSESQPAQGLQASGLNQRAQETSKKPGIDDNERIDMNEEAPMRSFSFQKTGKNVSSESEEIDRSKASQERQLRWASLLRQRPRDVSGDEMSVWLLSVLEVSNVKNTIGGPKETLTRENDDLAATETPSSGNGSSVRSSEPSEESTFGSSEGASSDCSEYRSAEASSQNEDSSSDSNEYSKFVNQSQLVERGVVKTESGVVSAYGVSTESSGPTDQSGGVDTTTSGTNDPSTSGSGTNSMGGSSSDSENGSNNDLGEPIPGDRKRSPTNEESVERQSRPPVKKRKQNIAD